MGRRDVLILCLMGRCRYSEIVALRPENIKQDTYRKDINAYKIINNETVLSYFIRIISENVAQKIN